MSQSWDMGQILLLQRKAGWGFFSSKNPKASAGFDPRTWVPEASMLTTRPPKPSSGLVLNESFSEVRGTRRKAGHPPVHRAGGNNEWHYVSPLPYAFITYKRTLISTQENYKKLSLIITGLPSWLWTKYFPNTRQKCRSRDVHVQHNCKFIVKLFCSIKQ